MPCLEFKLCENFKISKIICSCKKTPEPIVETDLKLIKTGHKKYKELVPKSKKYIYLKILDTGEIISVIGKLITFFNLKTKDLLHKKLGDIEKCSILFSDFISPLFDSCVEKNLAYQFDFELKKKRFSCSLYPCQIPEEEDILISSVDIVIRYSHNIISTDTNKFILV